MHGRFSRLLITVGAFAGAGFLVVSTLPASAGPASAANSKPHRTTTTTGATTTTVATTTTTSATTTTIPSTTTTTASGGGGAATFATGQMQDSTVGAGGCGTNIAGEPSIHVRKTNGSTDTVILGSENGLGGGSELWRGVGTDGGAGASGCSLQYRGQPNAVNGTGASGGDIDIAIGSAPAAGGFDPIYVASLNLGSVSVSTSTDNATTFNNVPVQGGLPGDDREWIAASGSATSLLTFHDITTSEIDVLRSDTTGQTYTEIAQAIPQTAIQATNNEIGNIVIDHLNTAGTSPGLLGQPGFWAYQSLAGPSSVTSSTFDEVFISSSNNGGYNWTLHPIPCSVTANGASNGLSHNFPNVSVAPNGNVWASWSDDTNVFTAVSSDHGSTWTCSGPVSTNTKQAIFPWLVATSNGVDLVYYGATTTASSSQPWYVYFVQNTASSPTGWGTPGQVTEVHVGSVCESGVTCNGGRQLFDDFGVDTDSLGFAHIAYSHDSPGLGGSGTYTGNAVQTGGTTVGVPN